MARPHPTLRGGTGTRFVLLLGALLLYGWGILLTVRADVGLGPWDVLHQAIADQTGWSFGVAAVAVSFAVLFLAAVLGERPGVGTLMNAVIVGSSYELFDAIDLAPNPQGDVGSVALDVAGIAVIGLASALYIGASFGAGPRDSLMLAVARRGPRIAVASWAIMIAALSLGFALGGPVGIGTVLFALGLGPAIEVAYYALVRGGMTQPVPEHPGAALTPVITAT